MLIIIAIVYLLLERSIPVAGYTFNGREGWQDISCDSMDDCRNTGTMIGNYTCTGMGNCFCGSAYNCYCKGNMGDCNCQRATNCIADGNLGNVNGECVDGAVTCMNGYDTCNCGTASTCACFGTWDVNYDSKITDYIGDESGAYSSSGCTVLNMNNGGSVCLNAGAIAGIVIGSVIGLALLVLWCWWCRKQRIASMIASSPPVVVQDMSLQNYPNSNGEIQIMNQVPPSSFFTNSNEPLAMPVAMPVGVQQQAPYGSVYPQHNPEINPYQQFSSQMQQPMQQPMQMGGGPMQQPMQIGVPMQMGGGVMGGYPHQAVQQGTGMPYNNYNNNQPNNNTYSQVYPQHMNTGGY